MRYSAQEFGLRPLHLRSDSTLPENDAHPLGVMSLREHEYAGTRSAGAARDRSRVSSSSRSPVGLGRPGSALMGG